MGRLIRAQLQLHACAIELEGCLCICPVREMSVIFYRIRSAHHAVIRLRLSVRPELIIAEPEQSVSKCIVIDLQCIHLIRVFCGSFLYLDLIDSRNAIRRCDHQTDSLCIHRRVCRHCRHCADLGPCFSKRLPITILIQIFQMELFHSVSLFQDRHLVDCAWLKCICQYITSVFFCRLPVCLAMRIKCKGCISSFPCRISRSCCICIPEVKICFPASQSHGKAVAAELDLFDLSASILVCIIFIYHIQCVFRRKISVHCDRDLLARIVRRSGFPCRNIELIISFSLAGNKTVHDHECLRRCRALKIFCDLALIQSGKRIVVAEHHISRSSVMSLRKACHTYICETVFQVFTAAGLIIKIAHAETICRGIRLIPYRPHLEHDPVIVQTCQLIINSMNAVNDLSPFQKPACRRAVLIPQISAVKLIFQTEEVQPFRSGQDRSIYDQILIGLGMVKCKRIQILPEQDRFGSGAVNASMSQFSV